MTQNGLKHAPKPSVGYTLGVTLGKMALWVILVESEWAKMVANIAQTENPRYLLV